MSEILVIIPAYNEASTIAEVVLSLHHSYPECDVLVVNDGSLDNTSDEARLSKQCIVIDLPFNIGIGGAVQCGLMYAQRKNYKYAIQFDADGQHMISELPKILDPIKNNEADCMIGSRFTQESNGFKPSSVRMLGIILLRWFSFVYTSQWISDQSSGFRAYNPNAIQFLADHYPGGYPEPEVIVLLAKNGFKIKEVFTEMRERQGGVSSIPLWKGPYYILRVLLSMTMAACRSKIIKK